MDFFRNKEDIVAPCPQPGPQKAPLQSTQGQKKSRPKGAPLDWGTGTVYDEDQDEKDIFDDHYDQDWRHEEEDEGDEDRDWHLDLPHQPTDTNPHAPARRIARPPQMAWDRDFGEDDDAFLPRPKGAPPPAENPIHRDHYLHQEHHVTEYLLYDAWFDEDDPVDFDHEED